MVITAQPSQSLAAELPGYYPTCARSSAPTGPAQWSLTPAASPQRCLHRSSPPDSTCLTYFKGSWARSASEAFTTVDQSPDGTAHTYELAARLIDLPVPAQPATGGRARNRQPR